MYSDDELNVLVKVVVVKSQKYTFCLCLNSFPKEKDSLRIEKRIVPQNQ